MARKPTPPRIRKFAAPKQRKLDQLLDKNAEGSISVKEKGKLDALVAEAEGLMVENAQRLAVFARQQTPQAPVAAVPVTVWVNPTPVEK
jgi:hypothetical protein